MDVNVEDTYSVELHHVPINWDLANGRLNFFGLPAAILWLDPSLLHMLEPLVDEIGIPLFRLLVAEQSSQGTSEDYHAMVTVLGNTFQEGFLAWGRAVGTAGWGKFELPQFDSAQKQAVVVVRSPWELVMQGKAERPWGCPFLQGKIIGIFSHALGHSCWATEHVTIENGEQIVTFQIYASTDTIGSALQELRDARKHASEREVELKTAELLKANAERAELQEQLIQMQAAALAELSTPLIPLNDKVMIMPLIGAIDSQRAQQIVTVMLEGVARHQAQFVIIDITGVSVVDTAVANVLIQAARSVGLLGAQAILTGIRPEIAQTLVGLGVDLGSIITQSSMQSGVAYAMRR